MRKKMPIVNFSGIFFTLICSLFPWKGYSLEIPFIPPVYNYTTAHYKAGNQNWSIAQDQEGVIYFGNNNGLLSFDGVNWNLHKLPNNLAVKSIFIDFNQHPNRIYVGSFEEFGYFERDRYNRLIYHSLRKRVKDYQFHNDEIWKICQHRGKIYFQSFSAFFVLEENSIKTHKPYPGVLYFFPVGDNLFAQLINNHFTLFDGEHFRELFTRKQLNNDNVVAVLPLGEEQLLVTEKNGIFHLGNDLETLQPWPTTADKRLREGVVNRATLNGDSLIVIGTLNDGLFALNHKGEERWHINRNNGLHNNTVLSLFSDREQNIWAALDNGIAHFLSHSPYSFFEPSDIQIGLVEDILENDHSLFLATNQGIYTYSKEERNFRRYAHFDTQSWFIEQFNRQLFVGHNLGTSLLEKERLVDIPQARTGGLDMKQIILNGENHLLQSSYTALYVYDQDPSGNWQFSHQVKGFSDLIRNIEIDHTGNIWAGHMYKGVYRLKLSSDLDKVTEIENFLTFDTALNEPYRPVKVMKLKGRVLFADGKLFYTYDDISRKIIPFEPLNQDLPEFADTYRIVPQNDHLFWFIRNKEYALVEYTADHFRLRDRIPYGILNNPPNEGRADIFIVNDTVSYFSLNGGIGKYLIGQQTGALSISNLRIASAMSHDREWRENQDLNTKTKEVIAYRHNNLSFQLVFPEFTRKPLLVESILEGYDNRWVPVAGDLAVTYNNLPPNDYRLRARVLDDREEVLSEVTFAFRIKNPWYKTWWATLLYILLIILASGLLIGNRVRRIIKKKNQLFVEQENRRLAQLEKQEREITRLRNEKLEAELTHKSKELASATMMIINHTEFLKNMRSTIQSLILNGKLKRNEGNELLSMINNGLSDEDEWNQFQDTFDLIHENFFRKLKERYPLLTPSDLKLCALLRLNYSSKEIGKMLNISIRGVEAARYRLRKKLTLSEADNLVEFMIKFQ
ncbi:hypothetical protein JS578_09325 [Dysgonomonadaceae bacterium zrk40]|nr:hypothetical protein JS578_09325 [Dysgonomonadaceae bacterium zrk40]